MRYIDSSGLYVDRIFFFFAFHELCQAVYNRVQVFHSDANERERTDDYQSFEENSLFGYDPQSRIV